MSAKLFSKFGPLKGADYKIGEEIKIGRSNNNQVVLSHKLVSGNHARIFLDPESKCYVVEDLNSLNGTLLDGVPINEPERLEHLHLINFGGSGDFFFLNLDTSKAPAASEEPDSQWEVASSDEVTKETFFSDDYIPTPSIFAKKDVDKSKKPEPRPEEKSTDYTSRSKPVVIPPALVKQLKEKENGGKPAIPEETPKKASPASANNRESESGPRLLVFSVEGESQDFDLKEGEVVLGRGSEAGFRINSAEISRRHVSVIVRGDQVFLRDLGSANGTFVNDRRIAKEVEIKPGMKISFGRIEAKLEARKS